MYGSKQHRELERVRSRSGTPGRAWKSAAALAIGFLFCLIPIGNIAWAQDQTAPSSSSGASTPNPPSAGSAFVVDRDLSREINTQDMFVNAVPVVKAVMILLVVASIACWMMLVVKALEIRGLSRSLRSAVAMLEDCRDLDQARQVKDAAANAMVSAAREEFARSRSVVMGGAREGLCERSEGRLKRIETAQARHAGYGLGLFAVVGSVAPFVGLFGTVWGIMHSFVGIAQSHVTSLAVVAPGIAEALLATSLGLVAAIPATVMYNSIGRAIQNYKTLLLDCAIVVLGFVSLEADILAVGRSPTAAVGKG